MPREDELPTFKEWVTGYPKWWLMVCGSFSTVFFVLGVIEGPFLAGVFFAGLFPFKVWSSWRQYIYNETHNKNK